MYEKGYEQKDIATALKRDPSGISYELNKNKTKGKYDPKMAHMKAKLRRKNASFRGKKIVGDPKLRAFVEKSLKLGQSIKAIAGRICRQEKNGSYAFMGSDPYLWRE